MNAPEIGLGGIEHATALVNPVSTKNRKGKRLLERLRKASPFEIDIINTSTDHEANVGIVRRKLEKEADSGALIVVSGDGFFNVVVDTIITNGLSQEAKLTPLWSLGGGNADDGVHAKHTKKHRKQPELVLNDGRIIETHPIRVDILRPQDDEPETRSAAFYATLGMTALASSERYLNKPSHRKLLGRFAVGRYLSEPIIAARALWTADISHARDEEKEFSFFDMQFANSHIMAKYFHFPVNLTEDRMFQSIVPDKTISSLTSAAAELRYGNTSGRYLDRGEAVAFETLQDTYAQFDGEAQLIPSGSNVKVSLDEQPIRLVISNPEL